MKTCQKIGVLIVGITPIQMENIAVQFVVLITKNPIFHPGYNRFLSELQKKLGPVDIKLATTLMDLESKINSKKQWVL